MNAKNISPLKMTTVAIIIATLLSCHIKNKEKGIEFKISNNSEFAIKSIKITTSENLAIEKIDSIEAGESISGFLSMTKNKTDGNYILEFIRENGKKESRGYGYYTNGAALEGFVEFKIKNDTVMNKFSRVY